MIPKIVHYIWFGEKPFPEKIQKCIDSWKIHLIDYQFILWNEDTFDVNCIPFTKVAYENKKWAFVSDYVRVYALYNYGGWYLDTDNEICKPLAPLEKYRIVLGTDDEGSLTALMGSEPQNELWYNLLFHYKSISFLREDGTFNMTVNNKYIEKLLLNYGFKSENRRQSLREGIEVFPDDYFHVVSFLTQSHNITHNTYAIHWHTNTWLPTSSKLKRFIREKVIATLIGAQTSAKLFIYLNKKIYPK